MVAFTKPQQWKKEESESLKRERERSDQVYRSWILKMVSCKIQESKKKARRSINCW